VSATPTFIGAWGGHAPEAQAVAEQAATEVSEDLATEEDPAPTVTAVAVVEPDAPAPEPSLELSLDAVESLWPAVLQSLAADSPRMAALLEQAKPAALSGDDLTLAWPESAAFSKRQVEDPAKRDQIAQSIRAVTGASLRLAHELRADHELAPAAEPLSEDELVDQFKREFSAVEEPPPTEET
jgi:hypothetical protein